METSKNKAIELRADAKRAQLTGRILESKALLHKAEIAERRQESATPGSATYRAMGKRIFEASVSNMTELKHLERGHMPPIEVTYPHFKDSAEGIAHHLNARADPSRASVTMFLGRSTWTHVAECMADPEIMKQFGRPIPVRSRPSTTYIIALCSTHVHSYVTRATQNYDNLSPYLSYDLETNGG